MNFDKMLIAVQQGTVDGQENPIALIVPYKLWEVHKYVTLWDYAIDPLILAVNAKTWASSEFAKIKTRSGRLVR